MAIKDPEERVRLAVMKEQLIALHHQIGFHRDTAKELRKKRDRLAGQINDLEV